MKKDSSELSHAGRIITAPKHLRSSVWKYFGGYTIGGKITNKDEAVCQLCKKLLPYSTLTINHVLVYHTSEAAEASKKQSNINFTTSSDCLLKTQCNLKTHSAVL